MTGLIKVGHEVLAINGVNMVGQTHDDVVKQLQQATDGLVMLKLKTVVSNCTALPRQRRSRRHAPIATSDPALGLMNLVRLPACGKRIYSAYYSHMPPTATPNPTPILPANPLPPQNKRTTTDVVLAQLGYEVVRCLFPFTAQNEDELSLKRDDIV